MNPLTLLPLLAVALAAPGAHVISSGVLAPGAVTYTTGSLLAQPAVAQVQVPLTKTVHYENRPVVTGYQTTVLKPQLGLAAAPVVTGYNTAYLRQLPEITTPAPAPPADLPGGIAPPNNTNPAPPADFPTESPVPIPGAPGSGNGSSDLPIPGIPGTVNLLQFVNPVQLPYSVAPVAQTVAVQQAADAVVVEARSALPVAAPAVAVRAAQAADFEPLVTKERVLAPVRQHTQITPQVTQIQPEITVRRVVQDVPVATPVAYQTPVVQQVVQAPATWQVAQAPAAWQFAGQNIISGARVIV